MAGSPGTLTARGFGRRPAILIAGLLVTLGCPLKAGERTGDVLIVEHPERLVLFNRYQQRLTSDEYRQVPPFVPMVVVREHGYLGDGFTPCAAVEIGREPYYLLRDEGGEFSTQGEPGKTELFRNVTFSEDTLVLLRGRALRLRPAGGGEEILQQAGARVIRLFDHESKTYVRLASAPGRFGWLTLSSSSRPPEWSLVEKASAAGISPEDVLLRVRPVVDGANRSLRQIYAAISPETGPPHTPPSFRLAPARTEIRCILEPGALSGTFSGSMRALLAEMERVLGGTGLHAEISEGTILIPLR